MKYGYYVVAFEVMSLGFVRGVSTEDKTGGASALILSTQAMISFGSN